VPEPAEPAPAPAGRALRILLVEDTPDNRVLVKAYLKSTSWELATADNGSVAVETFTTAGPWDLVLMDMEMPVMDGYTATRTIRRWERERGLAPTPVIALTAYARAEEMKKSLEAGCDAHLSKPIKKAALLEAIVRLTAVDR
jgi:CheY-like chemotaxis protein